MNNDKEILYVAIFTCVTVVSWILFELIQTTKTTTVTSTVQQIIVPLSPDIDIATMQNLEKRKFY